MISFLSRDGMMSAEVTSKKKMDGQRHERYREGKTRRKMENLVLMRSKFSTNKRKRKKCTTREHKKKGPTIGRKKP